MPDWSDAELEASVLAYRKMEQLEAEGRPYSKRSYYTALEKRFGRSAKAFEYRMQNISAVLNKQGCPWIPGLKPAAHIGANVGPRIEKLLARHGRLKLKKGLAAAYKTKIPAMRSWLIRVAREGSVVRYGDVMEVFDIDRFSLRHAMDLLGHQAENRDEPIITALIVGKTSGCCSPGFAKEFGINDDGAERERLYNYWREHTDDIKPFAPDENFESRRARFVSVEVRPAQAAFRRRVFDACGGRCVVTSCDITPALDAAHRTGRSWRKGQNDATDGYVLRKDIHALYDAGLLSINEDRIVNVEVAIHEQYGAFDGKKIVL